MEGNSAKKVPILDSLVDTPRKDSGSVSAPPAQLNNAVAKPNVSPVNGMKPRPQVNNGTTVQSADLPQNRRTDKSQFEIELTDIVQRIMAQYFQKASEQIVQEVLREVRARLPGQRRD